MTLSASSSIAYCLYYTDGQFLTAQTMQTEADYFTNWIALQNQSLYNPGWLMGLAVTVGTGNTLAVDPGTGLDLQGDFLVLPGTGGVYTVPPSSQNPCYLYLCYPTPTQARAGMPAQTQNMAALLTLGMTLAPPANGITLAEISLDAKGGITTVTDRRTPVTSRIQPQPLLSGGGVRALTVDAGQPAASVQRQGTIALPADKLATPGDRVLQTVFFIDPGIPAFGAPPRVTVTVRGALPYAITVDRVDTIGFVLAVTAITSTAVPQAGLTADWIATTS